MGFETLGARESRDRGCQFGESLAGKFLDSYHLDEIRSGESATLARCSGSRQYVIGTGSIIARRFRARRAYEHRTGVTNLSEQTAVVQCQVFRR